MQTIPGPEINPLLISFFAKTFVHLEQGHEILVYDNPKLLEVGYLCETCNQDWSVSVFAMKGQTGEMIKFVQDFIRNGSRVQKSLLKLQDKYPELIQKFKRYAVMM